MPYIDPQQNLTSSRESMRKMRAHRASGDETESPPLSRKAQRALADANVAPLRPLRSIDDILSALEEAYAIARNDPVTDPISKAKSLTNTARAAGAFLEAASLEQRVIQLERIASVRGSSGIPSSTNADIEDRTA